MKDADLHAVIGPDFNRLFAGIPTPEAPMPIEKSPDFGHEAQEVEHGGVIDLNESTAGDRTTVAHINRWRENRDRNATPRSGGDEPEAA